MKNLISIFFICLIGFTFSSPVFGQIQTVSFLTGDKYNIEKLRLDYGKNKSIPSNIEMAALMALSHFPELVDTRVEFVFQKQCEFMTTKPNFGNFLKKRKNRTFRIVMTDNQDPEKGPVLDQIAFNALVGVIGHELSHVSDFSQRSSWSTTSTIIRYDLSKNYRRRLERSTDITTIEHGLGLPLYDIRAYFPDKGNSSHSQYPSYLDREEILQYIQALQ